MALTFPRDIFMEMFLTGTWQDITTSVRQTNPIQITRGRGGEQGEVAPGTLSCKLNNASGDFTPSNPMGQYFGQIGRGTPLRYGLTVAEDTFTGRTVVDGWGTAETGEAWTSAGGAGGSVLNSDWQVAGGVATHSIPVASGYRYSVLNVSYRDVEVAATVTVPITNITGGSIEPANLILRRNAGTYYMTRVNINNAEDLSITIHHSVNGELIAPVTVPGLVDSVTNKVIRVKMQCEGQTIRAKVYAPGAEPVGWHVEVRDTAISAAGTVGIRNGVGAGNTNTKPIVFSVDNFEVRALRFAGEIAELKPRWNTNHSDKWAELTASTVLRRIQQGQTPLKSTLRRAYLAGDIALPVQYWPCEDGEDAKQLQSDIDDRHMVFTGRPQFAQFKDFLSSNPLPKPNGSIWTGDIAPYTATGFAQLRFVIAVPKEGLANNTRIADLRCTGTLRTFRILYRTPGALSLDIYDSTGTLVGVPGGEILLNIDGGLTRISLELTQVGGNVEWALGRYDLVDNAAGLGGSTTAGTFIVPDRVTINPLGTLTDTPIGHIVVQSVRTNLFELSTAYRAYRDETPVSRANRLCLENGIAPLVQIGTSPHQMGPQLPTTLYKLLQECQDANQGTLYDSRFTGNTLAFRTVDSTYAQASKLTLDYAARQIVPPLAPDADDLPIRNDVTAKRLVGGEYRVSRETGPMNAQDPGSADGAVGRYDQQVPVNMQSEVLLPDIANWALSLGTTEDERWPKVRVNLRKGTVSSIQSSLMDLDIDDRITLTNLDDADYYDDVDLLLRGYTETYNTAYEHTIEFNCAPYSPYNVPVLDDGSSRLEAVSSTLTSSITSTATSFTVTSTNGELWTTDAGNFPMDIKVGGERIRLSGISGASSPQTFTVAGSGRSVNGVVKAHAADTAVNIFTPSYLGL